MPETIPKFDKRFLELLPEYSFPEIGQKIASLFLSDNIESTKIKNLVDKSFDFDAPLVSLNDQIHVLELWHGPTLAFKDFGARFMAQLMSYFVEYSSEPIQILVATSGDTGSAIANSFLGVDGIKVSVLYPKNRVSKIQEQQFTTLGKNITAYEVEGSFDDCQKLVKAAFLDRELNESLKLTSANSINIGRLIPQIFYYVSAFSQLNKKGNIIISVPSGNFGNLTAGIIAMKMGLPIRKFIASTNINKIIPEYLKSGHFSPEPSIQTISNAMDVGNPSNFERLLDIFNHSQDKMKNKINGYFFSDEETKSSMRYIHSEFNYIVDPHGAVGFSGLTKYLTSINSGTGIFLGTAHPAKFFDIVKNTINIDVNIPERLASFMKNKKQSVLLSNSFDEFKNCLLERGK
tara:strand:- start:193185 stop:194396 length:1212 start_codon:yes stop_codon:yes gene_type:complete